ARLCPVGARVPQEPRRPGRQCDLQRSRPGRDRAGSSAGHPRPHGRPGAYHPGDPCPAEPAAVAGRLVRRRAVGAQRARRRAGQAVPRPGPARLHPPAAPGRTGRAHPAASPSHRPGHAALLPGGQGLPGPRVHRPGGPPTGLRTHAPAAKPAVATVLRRAGRECRAAWQAGLPLSAPGAGRLATMKGVPVTRLRVLLSEASSLTAREHLTVLGAVGVRVEAMSSDPFALCRWSRGARRLPRCPASGTDPAGYLHAVSAVLAGGGLDARLPTHEQAWLFAAGRDRPLPVAPVALAPAETFARVQSKAAFARLLDELGAPQPRWWPAGDDTVPGPIPCPHFLNSAFSTAGQGVRLVRTPAEHARARTELRATGQELIAQAPAPGQYGQVQALFDDGRLVAAHTSVQAGRGRGGSAAARPSVDPPRARFWAAAVGGKLAWHGGLTMDYFHQDGEPVFIECNPRTVEPGNATASGVNLPLLGIALATGRPLPDKVLTRRPGGPTP